MGSNQPVVGVGGFRISASRGFGVGTEGIDVHPQDAVGGAGVQAHRACVLAGGPQRRVEGQQMLFARVVLDRERRLPPVVEQIAGSARA